MNNIYLNKENKNSVKTFHLTIDNLDLLGKFLPEEISFFEENDIIYEKIFNFKYDNNLYKAFIGDWIVIENKQIFIIKDKDFSKLYEEKI